VLLLDLGQLGRDFPDLSLVIGVSVSLVSLVEECGGLDKFGGAIVDPTQIS
jgi:hypothetical protein